MKILEYIGEVEYIDPLRRFIALPNDLVEFTDQEAEELLKEEDTWQLAELLVESTKQAEK